MITMTSIEGLHAISKTFLPGKTFANIPQARE